MRNTFRLLLTAIVVWVLSSAAIAQQSIQWQPTVEVARQVAANSNRLVLIHFWAAWCGACRSMERDVLGQPAVAAAVQAQYVPVKVNRDYFPATCRQYGVTALPCQVVLTPEGQVLGRFTGLMEPGAYVAELNKVASAGRSRSRTLAQTSTERAGNPPGPASQLSAKAITAASQVSAPVVSGSTGNPPLGLDGYCPVQLIDDMLRGQYQWTLGDRRWGAIHRGRTYLFRSQEHQQRFLAEPDRYAPVLSGNDIVRALDGHQAIVGRREHGVLYDSRIYLFADEGSLEKFSKAPNRYATAALQARRADHSGPQGLR